MKLPRVAFFTDSYHEVNGVALTSREFAKFARARGYPFFSVHAGPETRHWEEGPFETMELAHSPFVLRLEQDLRFDLGFLRHRTTVRNHLRRFAPELIHVTGPSHMGILGALLAHDLKVPLVASWHTNVHEYAGRRLAMLLSAFPAAAGRRASAWAEKASLDLVIRFYRLARGYFAPNIELVEMLHHRTGRPAHLMQRGIDCDLYHPVRRTRNDGTFVIGYVGRLSPEKNVRLLAELEQQLLAAGARDLRFLIVGHGSETEWLREHIRSAELPGVRRGLELAECYANMDCFVFPSETDTFGNVVLEAHASGVPALVSAAGGPKFLVQAGSSGFVCNGIQDFTAATLRLYRDPLLLDTMRRNARQNALNRSWNAVFDGVYARYSELFCCGGPQLERRPQSAA